MTHLVGLDVGTTTIKAVVYDPVGRAVGRSMAPTPTHFPRPGWAYQEPDELWSTIVGVLRAALADVPDPRAVAGIAVASVGEALVPLDAAGEPTSEIIAWFDTRTRPQAEWLDRTIGKDVLFARCGVSLQPIFSLCKLLWLREERPESWARTVRCLLMADWIAWKLCGVAATDFSLASRTLMLNLHRLEWDADTLAAAEIEASVLAPLVHGGTRLGSVRAEAARETGLPTTCVVAAGGHDHVCGALAAGVIEPGQMLNSLGTAEALFLPLPSPLTDPAAGRQGYTQGAHVVGARPYVFGSPYTSGASIAWARDLLGEQEYDPLMAEAAEVPPGSLGVCFLPHLRLASPPHDDPKSRGSFVGLSTDVGRGALTRAVIEGLAFETRATYEPLLTYAPVVPPTEIRVIGGGARNPLLLGIKATVLGQPLTVVEAEEATALGAAVLGGLGAGVYAGVDDALGSLRLPTRRVEPTPADASLYEAMFRNVYARFYDQVAPLSHALVDIQSAFAGEQANLP